VSRDPAEQRSFYEANHLDSDIDMVGVIRNLLLEEQKRQKAGDSKNEIFIRPDHGHPIMGNMLKNNNSGYSGVVRLKGLAEVKGVIHALSANIQNT